MGEYDLSAEVSQLQFDMLITILVLNIWNDIVKSNEAHARFIIGTKIEKFLRTAI